MPKFLRQVLCWLGFHPRPMLDIDIEFTTHYEDGTTATVRKIPGVGIVLRRECPACGRWLKLKRRE